MNRSGLLFQNHEARLVRKASRGDETSFLLIYERHRLPIYHFVYRFLGSRELAEEITHDCFLSLVQNPIHFDPGLASLRTYLFAAARNLALKHLRQTGHESTLAETSEDDFISEHVVWCQPLQQLLEQEMSEKLREALAELMPLQREAFILFECEELSLLDVAAITGSDVGTIKSRLHRARARLRKLLAPYLKSASSVIPVEACEP